MRKFLQRHPEVNLHVEYTGWNRIYGAIVSGQMDLGVVACPERQRSIEIIPLVSEELVLVVPPNHRLSLRRKVKASDIEGEKFVAFQSNIPTRRHIDKILKREKTEVDIVMEFDNIELLKRAIMVGCGVSILPKGNVEMEVGFATLSYSRFDGATKQWERPVAIVRRRGKAPGPAEKMFLGLLRTKP